MWNIKKIISIVICMSVIAGSNMVNASVEPKTTWLKSGYGILGSFNEGLIKVTINGKDGSYGFIDKSGNLKISPKYNSRYIYDSKFSEGLAIMSKEYIKDNEYQRSLWGYIDKSGNEVVAINYSGAEDFSEGLGLVQTNTQLAFIDKTGAVKISLPKDYSQAESFSEGLAAVRKSGDRLFNSQTAYIDKSGEIVIPFKDYWSREFKEGMAMIMANNRKMGYIDKSGNEVISPKYYEAEDFSEGLAAVQVSNVGKWGYIDKTGREVVPLKYNKAESFSEGLAAVEILDSKDGKFKWGYIDKSGKEVITPRYESDIYDYDHSFNEGLAMVKLNGKYGYIDKTGKVVIPIKYNDAYKFSEGVAVVKLNGKTGIIHSPLPKIPEVKKQISVYINNKKLDMPVDPIIQEDRTLVPLRAIFEAMGASVEWNQTTKTVTAIKDNKEIKLQIGNKVATVDGENVNLDVSAIVINDSTLVPVRFIGETLGAKVVWNKDTTSVLINF